MAPTVAEVGQDTRICSDAREVCSPRPSRSRGPSDAIAIWSTSDDCRFRHGAGCAVSPDKSQSQKFSASPVETWPLDETVASVSVPVFGYKTSMWVVPVAVLRSASGNEGRKDCPRSPCSRPQVPTICCLFGRGPFFPRLQNGRKKSKLTVALNSNTPDLGCGRIGIIVGRAIKPRARSPETDGLIWRTA
jgi:hypothetical protein